MSNVDSPIEKISADRRFIIDCYTEMLTRINENGVVDLIKNTLHGGSKIEENELSSEKIIQALSIYFQLITMVEENAATQYRRRLEDLDKITTIRGSWAEAFHIWKNAGISEDEMLHAIAKTQVMPVITAHPTEAKRITVIEIHRELYLLLVQKENTALSKLEQNVITEQIIHVVERWWRTGEIYLEKPDINRARNSGLTIGISYIVGGIIPLSPYFFNKDAHVALNYSVIVTLITLFIFGYFKSKVTEQNPIKGAFKVMFIGALAAGAAFYVAKLFS